MVIITVIAITRIAIIIISTTTEAHSGRLGTRLPNNNTMCAHHSLHKAAHKCYGPTYWFSSLTSMFSSGAPPLFLSNKAEHDFDVAAWVPTVADHESLFSNSGTGFDDSSLVLLDTPRMARKAGHNLDFSYVGFYSGRGHFLVMFRYTSPKGQISVSGHTLKPLR